MIEQHKTWDILDSSKIRCYMTCPRKFFFKYILGWVPEGKSIHLVFGEAWHRAMEYLFINGLHKNNIEPAYARFIDYYSRHIDEHEYEAYAPKEPNRALDALTRYVIKYKNLDTWSVEYTEVAGTVPITGETVLHFRMDAVVKEDGLYSFVDHKTGSRAGSTWVNKWQNSFQILLYLHCLYSMFGSEQVLGALINGAIFRKNDTEFKRVKVRKSPDMMESWLRGAQYWARVIKMHTENFRKAVEDGSVYDSSYLQEFPQNPTNCTKYGTCPYFDYCVSWSNPVKRTEGEPPLGFEVSRWNPAEIESNETVEL